MSFVYSIRHIKNTISVFFFQNTGVSVPEHSVLFFFFFLSQGIVPSDQFHEKGLKSKNEVMLLCLRVKSNCALTEEAQSTSLVATSVIL